MRLKPPLQILQTRAFKLYKAMIEDGFYYCRRVEYYE